MKNAKINNINNDKNGRHPDLTNIRNSYLPSHRSIAVSEHTGKSERKFPPCLLESSSNSQFNCNDGDLC